MERSLTTLRSARPSSEVFDRLARRRRAALEWANTYRVAVDMDELDALPLGVPGAPCGCPLARATGLRIDGSCWDADGGQTGEMPRDVGAFALEFDAGHYPDLVDDRSTA